ncbi:MAG: nucleoside monophosphate kinase, partial [Bacteroidetes bacterium]|nr:nucleoside monophosphate kinase [Bacteroidota bacterium]
RTMPQAEALDRLLEHLNKTLDFVIEISVDEPVLVERLSNRLVCRNCGTVYNKLTQPPAKEGVCDRCGGEIYQRSDDRKEAIHHRLKVYERETSPLREYYQKKGLHIHRSGDKPVTDLFEDLLGIIGVSA